METSDQPYRHFKDKELYGPDTIDGDYQPRDWDSPNALERKVQTLATAVERLTQWNHELER